MQPNRLYFWFLCFTSLRSFKLFIQLLSIDATHYYIFHTIPRNKSFSCDPFVNNAVKRLHNKCCKNQHSHKVLGKNLKLLPVIENVLDAKKHYLVRLYLYQQKLLPIIQSEQNDNHTNVDENTDLNEPPPNNIPVADPSPQQLNDNEISVDQNSGLNEPPRNNVPVAGPPPPQINENESNTDQSDNLNERPSNNLTAALPPLQQVNDNESNANLNNDLNEILSNNRPVVNPSPQELNEDQN